MNSTFGIWASSRRFVAVEVDSTEQPARAVIAARTDEARARLVAHAIAAQAEVVISDALLQEDPVGRLVVERRAPLWIVPPAIVDAVIRAAKPGVRGPRAYATLLARLVREPLLQVHLRRVPPRADDCQLRLL